METWKTLERRLLLDHSKYLKVEEHTVGLPDGRQIPGWPWVITRDYIIAAAVDREGKFVLFRQTKYAVEGTSLAPVGGYLEVDEEPLAAAKRELLEETGHAADRWIFLGAYRQDGNHGAGTGHLFLALGATKVAEINADDLEEQEMLFLAPEEVEKGVETGEFKVMAWACAMAMSLLRLRAGK